MHFSLALLVSLLPQTGLRQVHPGVTRELEPAQKPTFHAQPAEPGNSTPDSRAILSNVQAVKEGPDPNVHISLLRHGAARFAPRIITRQILFTPWFV